MYYATMKQYDAANGDGIRCSLFVSGCTHHCPGCFNKEQQSFEYGKPWTLECEQKFIEMAKNPLVTGISILGGEPMDQTMDYSLLHLLSKLHDQVGKPIWLWSGYTYEEIIKDPLRKAMLSQCDVLVDGEFDQHQYDITLKYRGSSNQRVIDIQKSFLKNKIIYLTN